MNPYILSWTGFILLAIAYYLYKHRAERKNTVNDVKKEIKEILTNDAYKVKGRFGQ